MSRDQVQANKATFTRLHDALSTGDWEITSKAVDEAFAPDALLRVPLPIQTKGAEAVQEVFDRLFRAFPDMRVTVDDVIAEGDKVVAKNTVTGTHKGDYMGIPATGKSVTYNEIFIARFAGGRIAETWGVVDVLSQMKQLGVIPV
jgi:steroid delta-isomerase-like uncharacterized protein